MLYIIDQTAGRISGLEHIDIDRLAPRQSGRETSANGTGPEETCKRQEGPNGAICRHVVQCSAFRTTSLPHSNCASAGTSLCEGRPCRTT